MVTALEKMLVWKKNAVSKHDHKVTSNAMT